MYEKAMANQVLKVFHIDELLMEIYKQRVRVRQGEKAKTKVIEGFRMELQLCLGASRSCWIYIIYLSRPIQMSRSILGSVEFDEHSNMVPGPKYEEVHLMAYANGLEARIGIGQWFRFYNERRPHQTLGYKAAEVSPVDLPLRLDDDAGASPTTPQGQHSKTWYKSEDEKERLHLPTHSRGPVCRVHRR
jgi:transposase InsO family protein